MVPIRATGETGERGVFEARAGAGRALVLAEEDGHFAIREE